MKQDVGAIETYRGNDPAGLADDIEIGLQRWSTGHPRDVLAQLTFCEGELALIMKALRIRAVKRKRP